MKDSPSTSINTTVHLPVFSTNQLLTWFRRAERHFHLKKINNSTTKADHVIEVLPESVFQQIAPWMDTQLAEIKYDDLKATLLKTFCPTSAVRARRLLGLPQQLPADRTPTQIWHEINTLRQLPELDSITGLHKQLDIAREIWLMCLAPQVRSALLNTDNCDMDDLVNEAEQRHNAHNSATHQGPAAITAIQRRPAVPANTDITTNQRRPSRPVDKHARATLTEPFICWYHLRHGDNAQRCSPGCQYQSKNSAGGRA